MQLEFQRAVVHHQMHMVVVDEFTSGLLFEDLYGGIILMLSRLLQTCFAARSANFTFICETEIERPSSTPPHLSYLSSSISGVQ